MAFGLGDTYKQWVKGTVVAEKVDKVGQSINGGRYNGLRALMVVEKGLSSGFGVRGVSHGGSGLWRLELSLAF